MAHYGVIADDLTGALDAGAGFAAAALRAALPFSGDPVDVPDADVVLINTGTREGSAAEAYSRTREAAERLKRAGIERVYKKIDSVLRGHPGPELTAVLDVFRGRALAAPAFPAQGRVTRDGVQYAFGKPVEPFGGFLRDALESAASRADVRDAASEEDLARIAESAAENAAYRVWCGTAGLAKQAPAALGLVPRGTVPRLPVAQRVLVLAGTGHPVTNAQLDALQAAALPGVQALVEGREYWSRGEPPSSVREVLEQAARGIDLASSPALVMTGGETAQIVCQALGARSIEVVDEALPGIPLGLLDVGGRMTPVATKSGGFGAPDALVRTCERLLGRR
ncbi:MAG TPA: four-carbon acid sugar kinase family protein [Chloroflexota bacterium]|nr:four-carbon acid sugar kinase family protein [Chloroflexota bacterium]